MRLSPHFSLVEFTRSARGEKEGFDNSPALDQIQNLAALCKQILEPLRRHFRKPIHISSGFRTEKLNQLLGGARQSQHLLGEAADLVVQDVSMGAVFQYLIQSTLPFDQCIYEKKGKTEWIHISYKRNRQELLEAQYDEQGKPHYREVNRATG